MPGTPMGRTASSRTNGRQEPMPRVFSSRYAVRKMKTAPRVAHQNAIVTLFT